MWRSPARHRRAWTVLFLQAGLFCGSALVVLAVRAQVASERLGDQANLLLTGGVTAMLALLIAGAARNASRQPTWSARVIRSGLPLGLLGLFIVFVRASLIDSSVEMQALVTAEQHGDPPATLAIGPDGRDVRLTGDLGEGVAKRLDMLLDAHPEVSRIHLTSDGGIADEGEAVGDVIAAHRLTTFVPDYCVSACTLAFVRGRERLVLPEARLGFHAPYEQGLFGATYKEDATDQRAAYLAAHISSDFVTAALKVDPSDIWIPPLAELKAAHVVTAAIDRYTLPDSSLDGDPTLAGARGAILANFQLVRGYVPRMPRAVDAIAGWYLDAYRRGRPEGEIVDQLTSIVGGAVAFTFASADDATLRALVRFIDRALAVLDDTSDCSSVGGELDLADATAALNGSDGEALALMRRAVDTQTMRDTLAMSPTAVQADGEKGATCRDWRRIYASLLRLPPAAAASEVRLRLARVAARRLLRRPDQAARRTRPLEAAAVTRW